MEKKSKTLIKQISKAATQSDRVYIAANCCTSHKINNRYIAVPVIVCVLFGAREKRERNKYKKSRLLDESKTELLFGHRSHTDQFGQLGAQKNAN